MPYALYIFENGYAPEGLGSFLYQQKVVLVVHGIKRALEILLKEGKCQDPLTLSFHGTDRNTFGTVGDLVSHLQKGREILVTAGQQHYTGKFAAPPEIVKMPEGLFNLSDSQALKDHLKTHSITLLHKLKERSTNLDTVLRRQLREGK